MMYKREKSPIAYALIALSFYCVAWPMANTKNSTPSTVTLICQDGHLSLSRAASYLLPIIEDIMNDMNTDDIQVPLSLFNTREIQAVVKAVEEVHTLLTTMEQETLKKYLLKKKYTPDDIPLHVRRIVQSHTKGFNAHTYANTMAAANYMLAPYLVNALAGEWVRRKFIPQDDVLNTHDVMTFIKKHRDYAQEKIYYECSIADLLLTSRKHHTYTALETELTKSQPQCTIPLLLPMHDYLPDAAVGNAIITSLVGWEFINKKIVEYPKQITIIQKLVEKIPVMSEFVEIDETDSSSEEELVMVNPNIKLVIPTLKAYTFLGLSSLERINLSNLAILTVEDNAFAILPKLQAIDLKNNSIRTFNTTGLDTKQLKTINLYGNPLAPGECGRLEALFGKDKVSCNK